MSRYRTREEQLRSAGRARTLAHYPWDDPADEAVLEDQEAAEDVLRADASFTREAMHRILARVMRRE